MQAGPIYLFGAYSPFVVACGSFLVADSSKKNRGAPEFLPVWRYRFLLVESGSLRLGDGGPVVPVGGLALLTPGLRLAVRLGRRARLSHLLFDVVPSPREVRNGTIVAGDELQPPPESVWGMDLPPMALI